MENCVPQCSMCVCFVNDSGVASDKFLELVIRFTLCTLVEIVVHVRYLAVLRFSSQLKSWI